MNLEEKKPDFDYPVINRSDVVAILLQTAANTSRPNNKNMANVTMRRKHKCRGRGMHSEILTMTFDNILFQRSKPIRDCISNEM